MTARTLARVLMIGALLLTMSGMPGITQAVNATGAFELDGNAVSQTTDDWNRVCHEVTITNDTAGTIPNQCIGAGDTNGATAVSWEAELNNNSTIFTGGGSKDPQDISEWAWKDGAGGLPDKDNLVHAFAARYSLAPTGPAGTCPSTSSTCELLVFGSDRFDNSGDAHQAFWFLQNKITLGSTPKGGGTSFNGVHENGDLLIISNFSNGGTTSTIFVYQWNSAVSGNLEFLASSSNASCATTPQNAGFCGIVNTSNGTTAPWTFLDKSANSTYLTGEFFEAAINLSVMNLADQCFQSVVAETRSSTSTTATLKDFVLGQFGQCESSTVTTPLVSADGTDTPIGTDPLIGSSATVKDRAVVTVSGVENFGGTMTFYICGPIATGTCTTGGTQVGQPKAVSGPSPATIVSDAYTVTSPGRYCFRGEYSGDAAAGVPASSDSSEGECFRLINPTTKLNKSVAVEVKATYSYTETNDGSVPLTPPTAGDRSSIVTDPECTNAGGTIAYQSGDTNNNNVLDPNETWTLTCTATFTQPGTYTNVATGHGIDPVGQDVTYCDDPANPPVGVRCDQDEQDTNTVTVSVDQGKSSSP